ncbi:hypothetical protein SNEBB_005112 [Seison nebaliae]|nr:hypothetical protein SNEBB_005112 [Seison nebaliae]
MQQNVMYLDELGENFEQYLPPAEFLPQSLLATPMNNRSSVPTTSISEANPSELTSCSLGSAPIPQFPMRKR